MGNSELDRDDSTGFHLATLMLKAFQGLAVIGQALAVAPLVPPSRTLAVWKCSNYFQCRVRSILRPRSNHALFARINSQPEGPQQSTPDAAGPVGHPFPLSTRSVGVNMCRHSTRNTHALKLAKADQYNSVINSIRAQRVNDSYCIQA